MKPSDRDAQLSQRSARGRENIATLLLIFGATLYTGFHFWLVVEFLPNWINVIILGALWIGIPLEPGFFIKLLIRVIWGKDTTPPAKD